MNEQYINIECQLNIFDRVVLNILLYRIPVQFCKMILYLKHIHLYVCCYILNNADIPFRYEWYIFGIIKFLNGSEIKICSLLCKLILFWITPTIMEWKRGGLWCLALLSTIFQLYIVAVSHWIATGRWFSPDIPVSSTNKTDHHDITEILLKVALNITTPQIHNCLRNLLNYIKNILITEACAILEFTTC